MSAYGTAARAAFFVALEQPGPWGRDAATQSHLPVALGESLSTACSERGGRLSLVRRPGRHPDDHESRGEAVYLAWCGPEPWLLQTELRQVDALLDLDFDALARGDRAAVLASMPGAAAAEPILLLCTNGRRDVCCAVRGRPVALEAWASHPGRVWEASHTGGHRFAPTGVLLPHGATLARLDPPMCSAVLAAAEAGELPSAVLGPWHDRGRSALTAAGQAAESQVRHVTGERSLTALQTVEVDPFDADGFASYVVDHVDGRSWHARCQRRVAAEALPESCGKPSVPVLEWTVTLSQR
ncbi:sucrase ferredoxin [Pedococcus sp. 5OH_020]|uniref:sucrase ferredoxin n=1 Tax=Pedococcus sp. 5OH_020 TaxID=2989814 RepID=UPI0022E9C66B|nr:sucrase ferredoxin [Pedococcus sp. 5OH_020]